MVLHLQNAHPVRPVGPRAVRQDLLHAGAAGASPSLHHLETPGGGTLTVGEGREEEGEGANSRTLGSSVTSSLSQFIFTAWPSVGFLYELAE